MRTRPGKGRRFITYGIAPFSMRWRREYLIEETEWAPDEMHRGGLAFVIHLGWFAVGRGEFEIGLDPEEIEAIEREARLLEDVEPEEIGEWRGSATSATFRELGFEYTVPEDAPPAIADDEHDGAEALG